MYLQNGGRTLTDRRGPVGNTSGQVISVPSYSPSPDAVARYSGAKPPRDPGTPIGQGTVKNPHMADTPRDPSTPYGGGHVKNPHVAQAQQNNNNGGKGKGKGKPNPLQQWLGSDEQYQKDRADLIKNFLNMKLTNKENRGNLQLDKQTTMGRLSQEEADNLKAMNDDFAARGMFGGAGYQGKLGEFNRDYTNQRTDALTSFQRNMAELLRTLDNARTLRDQNLQQARLEAIRRRAATLGITG